MLFSEFKETYKDYYAYQDWITVERAKELEIIPEKYWEFFSNTCECGSENIISGSLTQEMCCNPNCIIKQGYQLAEMFKSFKINGLGAATCSKIYRALLNKDHYLKAHGKKGLFAYNTIVEVLMVQWADYPQEIKNLSKTMDFFNACVMIQQKVVTFPQLIASLGLQSLGSNANDIFDGINSFAELSQEIKKAGSVIRFCELRGISSREKMLHIKLALESIAVADFIFSGNVRKQGLQKINVCVTGAIYLKGQSIVNKNVFIEKCNALCVDKNNVQLFEFNMCSAVRSAPFIIYSVPSNSSKFNAGRERGVVTDQFGEHPVLITADDFYNLIERKMEEWNHNLMNSQTSIMNSSKTKQQESVICNSKQSIEPMKESQSSEKEMPSSLEMTTSSLIPMKQFR